MPISDNLKTIFVHIPKNAGTAITNSKIARFYMGGHDSAKEIKNKEPIGATHFDYHTLKDKTFEECVNMLYEDRSSLKHQGWAPQYVWISDNEKNILVDKVFYHETLETDEEFNKLIPDLEKVNFSDRKSNNYKDYYTEDLIRKVSEIYEYDINLFKFKY